MAVQQITVGADEADQRLDRWFKRHFPALTHGRLSKLLRTGQVRVDGTRAEASTRLDAGQVVRVPPLTEADTAPAPAPRKQSAVKFDDRDIAALKRAILHQDADVIVLNKPPGLAVQGGTKTEKHLDGMLDALRFDAPERPRLVHRLDRDTSGVLVLARNARAAALLGKAFQAKETEKVYWAVVVGEPPKEEGRIDAPLAKRPGKAGERVAVDEEGLRAITEFRVMDRAPPRAALLELWPITGRTHQLRVHCAAMGCPILGDFKYGGPAAQITGAEVARVLHLHARRIRVPHPRGGWLEVKAPPPPHMKATFAYFGLTPEG